MNCTNQQAPQRGGTVPNPIWVGLKLLLVFPRVQVTPDTPLIQTIFSPCSLLNNHRRVARSLCKIGLYFLFSFLSLAHLLILLLLLISGNVHPNPCPVFPSSVCAGNVTWLGRSAQCCACSNWVHLKCSLLSFSRLRILGGSHSWSCLSCFFCRSFCPLLHLSIYLKLSGRSVRNRLLSLPVLSGHNGSPDTRFSRATTRLMSWPDGKRYLLHQKFLVVSLLLSLVFFSSLGLEAYCLL